MTGRSPNVFILMGVSATGKTTLGEALAEATDGSFLDGDDFHPPSNLRKMAEGKPLDDSDRKPWLETLANLAATQAASSKPTFIACSALKRKYRDILRSKNPDLIFLFLTSDRKTLRQRIEDRHESGDHFMPPSLLDPQLETLEPPKNALELDVSKPVSELVDIFLRCYPRPDVR